MNTPNTSGFNPDFPEDYVDTIEDSDLDEETYPYFEDKENVADLIAKWMTD